MNHAVLLLSLAVFHADAPQCKHPGIFSAGAVAKAYRDNQAYAAEFFEGKEIQISGRMLKMKKVDAGGEGGKEQFALLLSADGKPPKLVGLTFVFEDEDRCKLAQLFAGQYVSIRGTYLEKKVDPATGYTEVKFNKCRLAE
jgi:hypothetical protein